jgi:hypothetical protein
VEAQVTLKLTPREFDLLRTAVEIRERQQVNRSADTSVQPASRHESRSEAVELQAILDKLR